MPQARGPRCCQARPEFRHSDPLRTGHRHAAIRRRSGGFSIGIISPDQMGGLTITQAPHRHRASTSSRSNSRPPGRPGALPWTRRRSWTASPANWSPGEDSRNLKSRSPRSRLRSAAMILGAKARLTANAASSITTNGQSASGGDLFADITVAGLLDAAGTLRWGCPRRSMARFSLHGCIHRNPAAHRCRAALFQRGCSICRGISALSPTLIFRQVRGRRDRPGFQQAKSQGADAAALLRITDDAPPLAKAA